MSAVAKPSLLTLPPAVYKKIFKYVTVWNGIRCVTACPQLLEHRQRILELWLKWFTLSVLMETHQNVSKIERGAWLVWRYATVMSRPFFRSCLHARELHQCVCVRDGMFQGTTGSLLPGNTSATSISHPIRRLDQVSRSTLLYTGTLL